MAFTKVTGPGIHTLSNIISHNIDSSGIITATKFVGTVEGPITGDLVTNDWITHEGDTNTRIGFPDNDTVSVETAGEERLRIASDGNVGLGTDNPDSATKLHILDTLGQIRVETTDTNNYGILRFTEGGYSGSRDKYIIAYNDGNSNQSNQLSIKNQVGHITFMAGGLATGDEKLRITSAGNVGIGTDNPTDTLHVGKLNSNHGIKLERYGATNPGSTTIQVHSHGALSVTSSNNITHTSGGSQQHVWMQGTNEAMRIDENRRLGIGTDNPDRMLHVVGTGNALLKMEGDYSGSVTGIEGVLTASGADRYVTGVYGKVVNTSGSESNVASIRLWNEQASPTTSDSPGYITFNTTNNGASTATEKLRIDSSGNVTNTGIATSFVTHQFAANFAKLDLRGTNIANSNHYILSYGAGHANNQEFHMVNTLGDLVFRSGSSSPTEKLRIASDGKVHFGNQDSVGANGYILKETSGDYKFNIFASSSTTTNRIITVNSRNNVEAMRITADGRVLIGTDTVTYGTSDTGHEIKNNNNRSYTAPLMTQHSHLLLNNSSASDGDFCGLGFRAGSGDGSIGYVHRGSANNSDFVINTDGNANGKERFRIYNNGSVLIGDHADEAGGNAKLSIDCQPINVLDDVGNPANYGLIFCNDHQLNKANGIGFFNDSGSTCGGYIIHQDKGGSNIGDIIFGTAETADSPVERMRISKEGYVTKPNTPYFHVQGSPSITNTPHDNGLKQFANVHSNNGSHYSNSTGVFTVPVAGFYFFSAGIWSSNSDANNGTNYALLYKKDSSNGSAIQFAGANHHDQWGQLTMAAGFYCAVGDQIYVFYNGSIQGSTPRNYFSGCLIG